jgi:hypothetical protein
MNISRRRSRNTNPGSEMPAELARSPIEFPHHQPRRPRPHRSCGRGQPGWPGPA